jgi:tRNA nucleotidyltransferase (CCA-adding enzyme)
MATAQHAEVVSHVLKRIKPSEEERRLLNEAVKKILRAAEGPSKIYGMKPMLCGSVAKDTWLSPPEIDLFMLFDESLPRKKLEEYGLDAAKDIFEALGGKHRAAYSEHPYLTGLVKIDGKIYAMDVVPAYETSAQNIKSAVDRTPHHVGFILKTLDYRKGQQDEVRLLKKFSAARGCYGADLAMQGFSGYLCELLVIKFGTFLNAVEAASKWGAGTVINHIGKKTEEKFKSEGEPLVVPDPVDPNRNVAAAVSVETFYRFVKACREFEKTPEPKMFEKDSIKPYTMQEIKEKIESRGTRFYAIKFPKPDVQPDIYHSQMRKALHRIEDILKKEEFSLVGKDYYADSETVIMMEAEKWILPNIRKQTGPSVFSSHAKSFLEHYRRREIFIEGTNWAVILDRKYGSLLEVIKDLLTSDMAAQGIPGNIAKAMEKCEVASDEHFIKMAARMPEDFRAFLRSYFEKDLNVAK